MSWLRAVREPGPAPVDKCRYEFESAALRARECAPPSRAFWLAEVDRMLDFHAEHTERIP